MKCHPGMWAPAVHRPVQPPCRRVRGVRAVHRLRVIGINEDQVRRPNSGEMRLIGVHQKLRAVIVNGNGEMVSHAFMKIKSRCPPKGRGKIDSRLPVVALPEALQLMILHLCFSHVFGIEPVFF